jgi:hypothetical protein
MVVPSVPVGVSAMTTETTMADRLDLADPILQLLADILDDTEKMRVANENRLRQLTRAETDSDGEERGFGLTLDHPAVARIAATVAAMRCIRGLRVSAGWA